MHDPIKFLSKQGFDTQYVSKCVETLKDQTANWKQPSQFVEAINAVLGEESSILTSINLNFFQARYLYFYVVQNLLVAEKQGNVLDNDDLIAKSLKQADVFCDDHKVALTEEAREFGLGGDGETKTRSGTKTQRALQIFTEEIGGKEIDDAEARTSIIQRFQDELDMERSGALTYYHATKKRYIKQS